MVNTTLQERKGNWLTLPLTLCYLNNCGMPPGTLQHHQGSSYNNICNTGVIISISQKKKPVPQKGLNPSARLFLKLPGGFQNQRLEPSPFQLLLPRGTLLSHHLTNGKMYYNFTGVPRQPGMPVPTTLTLSQETRTAHLWLTAMDPPSQSVSLTILSWSHGLLQQARQARSAFSTGLYTFTPAGGSTSPHPLSSLLPVS